MTTFADREHALEAYYAAGELAAFRERSRRYRHLGIRLAGMSKLHGKEARQFILWLGQQCIEEPSDEAAYRRMAAELEHLGVKLSHEDIRQIAAGGKARWESHRTPAHEPSWIEFVTSELLALFALTPEETERPDALA
jgi:hypothetical protein